jgi:hypothetical protein
MNNRIILVLFVFVALIFTSGCNSNTPEEETTFDTGGISVEFMPGAPPEQISEDDIAFDLNVKIENEGEYDIDEYTVDDDGVRDGDLISVFLLGVNPATIGLCNQEQVIDESGELLYEEDGETKVMANVCKTEQSHTEGLGGAHYVSSDLIPGELTYLEWLNGNGESPFYDLSISSDQKLTFVAQVCYPYKTVATASACFSDNAYAQATGSETCSVSGEKKVSNTVAPIKVTKVVENPAGRDKANDAGKYAFTFTVENVGGGTVYSNNKSISECATLGVAPLNANQIEVESVSVGGLVKSECFKNTVFDEDTDELVSYDTGRITLVEGKGTYTCTVSQQSISGDYSDVIEIRLAYNYYAQTKHNMIVKNSLDFE